MADLPGRKVWGGREFDPPPPGTVKKPSYDPSYPGLRGLVSTRHVGGQVAAIEVFCPQCESIVHGINGVTAVCDHLAIRWPLGERPRVMNREESDMTEETDRLHEAADKALTDPESDQGWPGAEYRDVRDPRTTDRDNAEEVAEYLDETITDDGLRPYQVVLDIPFFEGAMVTVMALDHLDAERRVIEEMDTPVDKVLSVTEVHSGSVERHVPHAAIGYEELEAEPIALTPLSLPIKVTALGLAVLASVGAALLGWVARGIYRRRNS